MAEEKLRTSEIKARLNNIKDIYRNYLRKIGIIRKKEKDILANLMKKKEEEEMAKIRSSIQQK